VYPAVSFCPRILKETAGDPEMAMSGALAMSRSVCGPIAAMCGILSALSARDMPHLWSITKAEAGEQFAINLRVRSLSHSSSLVIDNPGKHRFELAISDEVAVAHYRIQDGHYVLTHTEVPNHLSGHGFGRNSPMAF
jgi:predicted GNAT family acetyltransferase